MSYDMFENDAHQKDPCDKFKHDCCDDPCKDFKRKEKKCPKKEEKGLLTELQVDQFPTIVPTRKAPNLRNKFANVDVCINDCKDRVVVVLTVEWGPKFYPELGSAVEAKSLPYPILVPFPAIFKIWRKGDSGPVLISEKRDSSFGIAYYFNKEIIANTTTTIHAVDPDPTLCKNKYFATIEPDETTMSPPVLTELSGFLGYSLPKLSVKNVHSYTLTAEVIAANKKKCK
ncbi:hypothetical protein SAMN02982927_01195 [Sporolactobacillus nakayamae]|uniref:Uncharacterized protein n=2 Tax=Sporolactobacillus nakayamae TaxID=269670 RepID=A0A1I2QFS3_9BACL|nr:hypothetical protein SAMN02982927_01195 [Sporolactobacillus nakayamae]